MAAAHIGAGFKSQGNGGGYERHLGPAIADDHHAGRFLGKVRADDELVAAKGGATRAEAFQSIVSIASPL